ncbi:MAG: flagellar brake protein [Desulfobulbaceae bacterium]|nr:flagellar brake protein [Desulfobulbaceae bacterium]
MIFQPWVDGRVWILEKSAFFEKGNIMESDFLKTGRSIFFEVGNELKVEIEGVGVPLESCLVGMEEDCLIIRTPMPFGLIKHKLYKGNELIVRYLCRGTVFGFQTKIIGSITNPVRLLFLEYPKIIQQHDLRSNKRSKCFIPIVLILDDEEWEGALLDITRNGGRCVIQKPPARELPFFRVDDLVTMHCKFPGIKGHVPVVGAIKNIKSTRKERDVGLNFHESITLEVRKIIKWYISTIEDYEKSQHL